jgi:hypothetical protein
VGMAMWAEDDAGNVTVTAFDTRAERTSGSAR